jgi:hypothetical protein
VFQSFGVYTNIHFNDITSHINQTDEPTVRWVLVMERVRAAGFMYAWTCILPCLPGDVACGKLNNKPVVAFKTFFAGPQAAAA